MSDLLTEFRQQLQSQPDVQSWVVGLSGGLDSMVLLHLAAQTLPVENLRAIHVNHQLQASASRWQAFCETQCRTLGIPCQTHRVTVDNVASVEQAARDARYRVFESELQVGECLLLAQHRDDQAETLLFRLLRGAGLKGLKGIPRSRALGFGRLFRPLLSFDKETLHSWARQHDLEWVEDPSNADIGYDRNFLRAEILPRLASRWPGFSERWLQTTEYLSEADQLLDDLAIIDLKRCRAELNSIDLKSLSTLSIERRNNLLRYWLQQAVGYGPGRDWLARVEQEVIRAKDDADPQLTLGDVVLRRFRKRLYITQDLPEIDWTAYPLVDAGVTLKHGRLAVTGGVDFGLKSFAGVSLRSRRDGDRCRPVGRAGSRSLKKLFQEHNIPPWLRRDWPVCVVDEEIVAVPGLCICEGWQNEKKGTGIDLKWLPFALSETGDSGTL